MLLSEVYPGQAIVDGRTDKRDPFPPMTISVRAMGAGSVAQHVNLAVNSQPIPCAYVTETGQVWILSGGGSGVIAFAGDDPTLVQGDRISLLVEALEVLGGEVEIIDEPEPVKPKRKNRKQVDEVPTEWVAETASEDVAEVATDVVAWTVNDEGEPF